ERNRQVESLVFVAAYGPDEGETVPMLSDRGAAVPVARWCCSAMTVGPDSTRKANRTHPRWSAEEVTASTCRTNYAMCCATSLVRCHGAWPSLSLRHTRR